MMSLTLTSMSSASSSKVLFTFSAPLTTSTSSSCTHCTNSSNSIKPLPSPSIRLKRASNSASTRLSWICLSSAHIVFLLIVAGFAGYPHTPGVPSSLGGRKLSKRSWKNCRRALGMRYCKDNSSIVGFCSATTVGGSSSSSLTPFSARRCTSRSTFFLRAMNGSGPARTCFSTLLSTWPVCSTPHAACRIFHDDFIAGSHQRSRTFSLGASSGASSLEPLALSSVDSLDCFFLPLFSFSLGASFSGSFSASFSFSCLFTFCRKSFEPPSSAASSSRLSFSVWISSPKRTSSSCSRITCGPCGATWDSNSGSVCFRNSPVSILPS
mmetsp:Transcript_47546/g.113116  ORF Transcript_47546/g.113116 Transcript_47546/m.113116 type:complete len:324 (+) Transcript_47546:293-1264(+)